MSRLERMNRWTEAPQPRSAIQIDDLNPGDWVKVIAQDGTERLYTRESTIESQEPAIVYQGEQWAARLGNKEWSMCLLDRATFRKARQIKRKRG